MKINNKILFYIIFFLILVCICFYALRLKTAVVFTLNSSAGFFSVFFMMCKAYLYAKSNNYDFYIDHDNWQYTYNKGWHDYFTSLRVWEPENITNYIKIHRFNHGNCKKLQRHTIYSYITAIQEIFVVNETIQNMVKKYIANTIQNDYVSLYVRRGDKTKGEDKEMDELTLEEIVKSTIQYNKPNLFVQTDDYSVIEELKTILPFTNIFTFTNKNERGSKNGNMLKWSSSQRKLETENLLASILVFVNGSHGWSDHRSNVGRFHKLFAYNNTSLYPYFKHIHSMNTIIDPAYSMKNIPYLAFA